MNRFVLLLYRSSLLLGLIVASPTVFATTGEGSIPGTYSALLDLEPLGTPRIEALGVVLGRDGGVIIVTEHEADKESTGVGIWERLPGGLIGMGALSFRFGPDPVASICGLVGVISPPGNCVLKFGATLRQEMDGILVGEMIITVESTDGSVVLVLPDALPIFMEPLRLEDFERPLP
jgi:hypothetical protein